MSNDRLRALVTGGGSGIGLCTARHLVAGGAVVTTLDVNPLDDPIEDVRALVADVADREQVDAAVAQAAASMGGLDVLVNNAGIGAQGTIEGNDDAEWARVLDVNVVGVARVSRAAWPHLRRSGAAAIVNLSSIAATAGLPDRALYSATKGAIAALTRAMAADGLADGIRVNAVEPGTVRTPWVERLLDRAADPRAELAALSARQPHGRLVEPDEVARAIAFLASPAAGSITGAAIAVDGGMAALRPRRS